MGEAFLRAMAMKISQSEAFFDALSSRQLKTSLHRVKMMSYKENIFKNLCFFWFLSDLSFFVPMGPGMLNFKFREFSGTKIKNFYFRRNSSFRLGNSESGRKISMKDNT